MQINVEAFDHVYDCIQEKWLEINIFPRQFNHESVAINMSSGAVLQHSTSDIIGR